MIQMRLAAIVGAGVLAAAAPNLASAGPAIAGGAYDNTLILGVDPASGTVTGYFNMHQDGPPTFDCIFYLKGRAGGPVATYYPGDPKGDLIKGALTAQGAGKVRVALPTEHGGCGNLWQFADKTQPADFELQKALPWTSVRVIKADKAYFYPAPGAATHGHAYLVKDNGVGVRAIQGGWVQADFVGDTRTSSGWLREADLYPAQ
jgi:hypothetical protein